MPSESDAATTNLPPQTYEGVFTMAVSCDIDAPIETVWDILTDFPKYGECQQITDAARRPLADQTPAAGQHLLMHVHILPTLDDARAKRTATFERILACDPAARRLAWAVLLPAWFLRAERWQALSALGGGTRYESREVFAGPGAYLIRMMMRRGLQESFDAMADALKARAEGQH
ncbi:uncharacterized protein BXZ73DRAFT_52039 [Epithele typhae]|uniref:uncharacterized protein n=1 Tax=Epithele typhae TaxID=378194 RepID=UPI002008A74E|nr:uncharacterized protein BXZ73DRAFT_52039 [Epithele typhae]KAH9920863.1 hypothetical protein BXZ73DRAFT_52039 [Epithele typhae]